MELALAFEDAEPFRLTVAQYIDLFERGVIPERPRTELLEGMIVCMNAQARQHSMVLNQLAFRLHDRLQEMKSPLICLAAPTVLMPPHNAPDPDIYVGRLAAEKRYFDIDDALLLIEISHTTLGKDRRVKRDIYARAGVPEYWVVDINKAEVHRFAGLSDGAYRAEPPVPSAGELRSLTIANLVIDGSGIL